MAMKILGKCIGKLLKIKYKHKMRFFGDTSIIVRPMSIIGMKYISIGENCLFNIGLRMEAIDEFNGKCYRPDITIGNNVSIQQGVHITCANYIKIGNNVSILPYALITDISHPYEDTKRAPIYQDFRTDEVIIDDDCMIGMGARILPGVHLGKHCVVGTNAVVTRDVAAFSVVSGIPARVIKYFDFDKNKWVEVKR